MTFYNIIFGLVFIMSFFTSISVLGRGEDLYLLLSESLLILLLSFNDIMNTSDAIENEKSDYTLSLKALDALNFGLYMIGIFAIQPQNKISNIDLSNLIPKHDAKIFWLCITATFFISFSWNIVKDKKLAIRYNKYVIMFSFFALFMFFLSIKFENTLIFMSPIFLASYFSFFIAKIIKPSFQNKE